MSRLGNFETIEIPEKHSSKEISPVSPIEEADRKKLDSISNNFKEPGLSEADSKIDSQHQKNNLEKERLNKREPKQEDLLQEGTARNNPSYGIGGGKQYFIPDAHQPLRSDGNLPLKDGCLTKTGETNLHYQGTGDQKIKNPSHVDNRPLSKAEKLELKQMDENTSDKPVITPKANSKPISKEELKQLDENTMDERGLPKVMGNSKDQNLENWRHVPSNQENRGVSTMPDAWSNPRELKDNEKFYQIRPTNAKEASDYFTNSDTVNACKDKNGNVNVGKLLDLLQIDPGENTDWTLREYEYHKNK